MLSKSYAATQQFQRQISKARTFEEVTRLFQVNKIDLVLQVESSTVWKINWNPIKGTLSGVLDLRIYPKIVMNQETYEAGRPVILRLEDPREISIGKFQDRLVVPIKQSIASMGFNFQ